MVENRILTTIRRALAGLPGADLLLEQQAGLVMRLFRAASLLGEDVEDVASAVAIGLIEAKQFHAAGKKKDYPLFYLAVLRAAGGLGLRQSGASFQRCGRSALAESIDDGSDLLELAQFDDPALILEACEAVSGINPLLISSQLAAAEGESISTSRVADRCGITGRTARYRKAKARAAAAGGQVQGDLFGGVE